MLGGTSKFIGQLLTSSCVGVALSLLPFLQFGVVRHQRNLWIVIASVEDSVGSGPFRTLVLRGGALTGY